MTFKEITTEELTNSIKNSVGRPPSKESDAQSLDDLLVSREKREALLHEVKRFAKEKELHKQRSKALSEDLKACAKDNFKLSVKKFNELVDAFDSGQLDDKIALLTSTVDTLQVLKEDSENE